MKHETFTGIDIEKFKEVIEQSDFDELHSVAVNFHDSLIKEVHLINSSYVDEDLSMHCSSECNCRLLIQIQWEQVPAVEILLGGVLDCHFLTLTEINSGHGMISYEGVNKTRIITFQVDDTKIICRRFLYRIAPELCGGESKFADEIVLDPITTIEWIDDEWVMCKECCEAWMPGERTVLKCPKCGY